MIYIKIKILIYIRDGSRKAQRYQSRKKTRYQAQTSKVNNATIAGGTIKSTTPGCSDQDLKIHSWVAAWPRVSS
jgi:hypothetical protein